MLGAELAQLSYSDRMYTRIPFTRLNIHRSEVECSIYHCAEEVWLVFRGTEGNNAQDWARNLNALPVKAGSLPGRWHRGYSRAVASIMPEVITHLLPLVDNRKLFVAGHSAGAGMAQVFTAQVQLVNGKVANRIEGVFLYGCPRVATPAGAQWLWRVLPGYRYTLLGDRVSRVPPRLLGYKATEMYFDDVLLVPPGKEWLVARYPRLGRWVAAFTPNKILGNHSIMDYLLALDRLNT